MPQELMGLVATAMLAPEMSAAQSMYRMIDKSLTEDASMQPHVVAKMLRQQDQLVAGGDLEQVRRTLAAQAATLDRLFHHLFALATAAQSRSPDLHQRYLHLAFKAQTQAMRTALALGRLCQVQERLKMARQANTAPPPKAAFKFRKAGAHAVTATRTLDSGGRPAIYSIKLPSSAANEWPAPPPASRRTFAHSA